MSATRFKRCAVEAPAFCCAVIWCVFGLSKLVNMESSVGQETWSSQFGSGLLMLVSVIEVAIALVMFSGRLTRGLSMGVFMLVLFSVVIAMYPPKASQSCGCSANKALDAVGAFEMLARVFFFASLHVLAYMLVRPAPSRRRAEEEPSSRPSLVKV